MRVGPQVLRDRASGACRVTVTRVRGQERDDARCDGGGRLVARGAPADGVECGGHAGRVGSHAIQDIASPGERAVR